MIRYTIIMPMFNAEKFLKKNLTFFKNNNRNDIEYLIINDGSTDNSYEIVKNANIENVILIDQKNLGVSYTRNIGIKNARGKYICFLDSDDYYEENILDFFDSIYDKDYDLIRFGYYISTKSKKIIGNHFKENTVINNYKKNSENYKILYTTSLLNTSVNQLIKRKILINNNIYFNKIYKYGEDLEFNIRLMHHVDNVFFSKKILYNYFRNEDSTTNKETVENVEKCIDDAINIHVNRFRMCQLDCPKHLNECYYNVSLELTTVLRRLLFLKNIKLRDIKKKINDIKKNENIIYFNQFNKKYNSTKFYKKSIIKKANYISLIYFKVYYNLKKTIANLIKYN